MLYRHYRSVRYRDESLYRYRRYRYPCRTELTEVSGTGIDVVVKLPKCLVPILMSYRCPVPVIPAVCLGTYRADHTLKRFLEKNKGLQRITGREVNEARTCSRPCACEKNKIDKKITEKSAPPKTHHEIHSSPATACNSRRHVIEHVPRASPCSPKSIDTGFVESGLVQFSQSVKTTNVTHTLIDTQTD